MNGTAKTGLALAITALTAGFVVNKCNNAERKQQKIEAARDLVDITLDSITKQMRGLPPSARDSVFQAKRQEFTETHEGMFLRNDTNFNYVEVSLLIDDEIVPVTTMAYNQKPREFKIR
ncbi:MAG: hypothetical protein JWM96_391 [Alphaproteobacteria bacterium]|nr:hypothetical protein [Alphaproteobacteria bacterium]